MQSCNWENNGLLSSSAPVCRHRPGSPAGHHGCGSLFKAVCSPVQLRPGFPLTMRARRAEMSGEGAFPKDERQQIEGEAAVEGVVCA